MRPSSSDQDWLLYELAVLISRFGTTPFLQAPLLTPEPRWFPDAWTPDPSGVERILRRLLGYAGLYDVRPLVEVVRAGNRRGLEGRHSDTPAWFSGIDRTGLARFGCLDTHFGEPDVLVAHLCHEVAHAWRHHREVMRDDRDEEEELTDLTTVYLGFGLFTANAALRHSTDKGLMGEVRVTSRSGYLPAPHFAYLLAVQVVARELGWCARRGVADELHTDQATLFRSWVRTLRREHGLLAWRLGLPTTFEPPMIEVGGTRAPPPRK